MVFFNLTLLPNVLLFIEESAGVRAEALKTRAVTLTLITFAVTPTLFFLLTRETAKEQDKKLIEGEAGRASKQKKVRFLILLTAAHILIGLFVLLYVLNIMFPLYTFWS